MKIKLNSKRLVIQTILTTSEAPRVLHYHQNNAEHFRYSMPKYSSDYFTLNYCKKLLQHQRNETLNGKMIKFWIFEKKDIYYEDIIGDFTFSNIVLHPLHSCFLGYKIDERYQGQGYMKEALNEGINFVFKKLNLHRIEVNIMPTNEKSLGLVRSLSFVEEGYSKDYLLINGGWEDHLRFALINQHFK